jgi:hypothetical protein
MQSMQRRTGLRLRSDYACFTRQTGRSQNPKGTFLSVVRRSFKLSVNSIRGGIASYTLCRPHRRHAGPSHRVKWTWRSCLLLLPEVPQ